MPLVRRWLAAQAAPHSGRLDVLRIAALALITLLAVQLAGAQQIAPYVDGITLVSSQRFDRDRTDFIYRIRVINPGGALVGASAYVSSSVPTTTTILDNEVTIGTLPAGSTFNSTDTFTLRQNRTVPFNPASLSWRILGTPANTRPVANAGPNQTTSTGLTVTLDGTASSDADRDPLTYRWQLKSRPPGSTSALSSSTDGRPTFRIDRGGSYEFELVVNDGRIDSLPATVQVSTINAKPIANAGVDRTVARGARVTLDGSASRDPDFDALNYRWTIVGAPLGSTAALVDASLVAPAITLDRAGTYRFRLVVSDSRLDSDPDEVVVSTENSAPLANAGADQAGTLNQRVTLDGSASGDADGDAISFAWSWTSRPAGSAAVLDVTDVLRPQFTPDRTGLYTVQLIVNDGFNDSAPDTVTVTVARPPNRAPNAVADTASTAAGAPVDVAVLANDTDPDGDTLTIQSFTQSANGLVAQVGNALRFTPATAFSGTATFDYTLSDGTLTATARVTVTVGAPANLPPVVNAGADLSATLPYPNATVTLQLGGSVSDDGRPLPAALVSTWTRVSGPGTALIAAPNSPGTGVELGAPGSYLFRLTATDGALTASDDVVVTVNAAINTAPSLGRIPDRTISLGDTIRVQLSADDSDPFDTQTFSLGAVPAGATLSSTGLLAWTAVSTTSASFTVNVRDRGGLTDSATFVVTVRAVNRPPVLGALGDDTTVVGANYGKTLSATDPDGGPVSFELLGGPAGLTLSGSTLSWRPGATQTGPATVKVQARDGGGATTAGLFRVTVNTVTAPLARDDSYKVKVGETLTVSAPGVLQNDLSPAGTPLSALRRSDPALGSLGAFRADGSFTYTAPSADPRPAFRIVGRQLTTAASVRQPSGVNPLLGDLNRDGRPDLVVFGFSGPTQVATAISGGTDAVLWRDAGGLDANFCENNLGSYAGYVLGDIEDDGQMELVTITGCRSGESGYQRLAAFRPDGSRKWVSPLLTKEFLDRRCSIGGCAPGTVPTRTDYSVLFQSALSIARLAANEAPVIMARAEIPATAGQVYTELSQGVLGYKEYGCRIVTGVEADMGQACNVTLLISGTDGRVLQVLRSPLRQQFNRGIPLSPFEHHPPIAADLDGDGSVEIISGADVWRRVAGTWTLAWQGAAEPEQVAVADLDGDGRQEVVWALDRIQQLPVGTPYLGFAGILIFDANGQELRRIPLPNRYPGMMTIADVDGDRTPEILLTEAGNLHVVGTDGSFKWTYFVPDNPVYPQPPGFRTSYHNNVIVHDLEGDGNAEVIFSSASGLHILEGRTGAQKALFPTGPRYANISASNTTFLTDWDNDGHADIISVGEVGGSPTESFAWVISAASNDWLPATKVHNQVAFQPTGVDDTGRILFDPSIARSYRNPPQLGTVRDPRETAGTRFDYADNDGVTDSANARVFLEILPQNNPPVFTSRAPTAFQSEGAASTVVFYRATAVDPDPGDTVTYSINATAPNGLVGPSPYMDVNPATGAVSIAQSTGFSDFAWRVTLTATDSQGASAIQTFVVRHETRARIAVPNVVGTAVLAATQALTAADLQSVVLQELYGALPAGQVLAQNPVASAAQTRGTTVLLTVSRGPMPVLVPNVVGLVQGQANTRLVAGGFSTGTVTRAFSATVPRGEVIAQSIAAGTEQVPGPVALVVSAGNGLALRLNNAVTTANAPIAFAAVSTDLAGLETAATGLSYAILPLQAPIGPNPIVTGSSIVPAGATRGAFRLTITDGGGRTASADFAVAEPVVAGEAEPMAAAFLRLSAALDDIDELLRQAREALAAGDVPRQTGLLRQMVLRWRQVDLVDLELSIPLSPERGFAPLVSQMAGFGVNPTPDDLLSNQVLADADADLKDWIAGLKAANTPIAVLDQQAERFGTRAARLDGLVVTEWGMVNNSSLYTILLARRIPALYEAIMNELAKVPGVNLPPTRTAALVGPYTGDASPRSLFAGSATAPSPLLLDRNGPQLNSTLAELAVTQATQWVVDKITEDFNKKYKAGKQFATDIMTQAFSGAAIVAAVSHIRQFVQGQDTGTIVSGASLSFRVFEAPYSFIEGPWDLVNPEMNQVFVIGPSLVTDVQPFITKFKDAMKYRQTLNPVADDGKYKSGGEIKRDLKSFKQALEDLKTSTEGLVETITNIEQTPTGVDRPCIFDGAPDCGQLLFDAGFRSVYKYRPPEGFESFTGLPLPIVFIVYNYRNNTMYFGTPPFLPTLAPPPAPAP